MTQLSDKDHKAQMAAMKAFSVLTTKKVNE